MCRVVSGTWFVRCGEEVVSIQAFLAILDDHTFCIIGGTLAVEGIGAGCRGLRMEWGSDGGCLGIGKSDDFHEARLVVLECGFEVGVDLGCSIILAVVECELQVALLATTSTIGSCDIGRNISGSISCVFVETLGCVEVAIPGRAFEGDNRGRNNFVACLCNKGIEMLAVCGIVGIIRLKARLAGNEVAVCLYNAAILIRERAFGVL